jgi:hypothetical protein
MKRGIPGNSKRTKGSPLAEHRVALVADVSGKRGRRYLKRQQLLELGEPAIRYLTEIVHRRPRRWFQDVDRLHAILQSHGPEVLRRAMEAGLQEHGLVAFTWRDLWPKVELSGGAAVKTEDGKFPEAGCARPGPRTKKCGESTKPGDGMSRPRWR